MSEVDEGVNRPTRASVPSATGTAAPKVVNGADSTPQTAPLRRPGSAMRTNNIGRGAQPRTNRPPSSSGRPPSASAPNSTPNDAASSPSVKNIWTIILEQKKNQPADQKEKPKNEVMECNLLFMGDDKSGKTTIKYKIQRKDYTTEEPSSTIALEYSTGKREENFKTLVAHFWELAGGKKLTKVVDEFLLPENIHMWTAVIVVNLAKSATVMDEVNFYLEKIKEIVNNICKTRPELLQKLLARCKRKFGEKHPDLQQITFSGVPTVIIATHSDSFSSRPPLHLKTMATSLRYLAHKNGCTLLYSGKYPDNKNEEHDRNFRAIFNYVMYSGEKFVPPKPEIDGLKPIRVVAGKDSFKMIGDLKEESITTEFLKVLGQDKTDDTKAKFEAAIMKGFDDYQEQSIEMLRVQKDEELIRYREAEASKKEKKEQEDEARRAAMEEKRQKAMEARGQK
ncbi:dynein light intermediate chain [Acrasis kona]|uniref:Cytoplasmic dynein 2 light intermediate chain 1 n=1 Tax=Acrasis kona TaxID=1008807 RepID=A0AAW2Z0A6_9EUKA